MFIFLSLNHQLKTEIRNDDDHDRSHLLPVLFLSKFKFREFDQISRIRDYKTLLIMYLNESLLIASNEPE